MSVKLTLRKVPRLISERINECPTKNKTEITAVPSGCMACYFFQLLNWNLFTYLCEVGVVKGVEYNLFFITS